MQATIEDQCKARSNTLKSAGTGMAQETTQITASVALSSKLHRSSEPTRCRAVEERVHIMQ